MSKRFVSIMFCSILLCLLTIPLLSQRISKKIDKLVKAYSNGSDFNGNVLVAKGNSIILNRGYGFRNAEQKIKNDADGIYQVASITKQFTSAIIMQLQQEGKLSVQDNSTLSNIGF